MIERITVEINDEDMKGQPGIDCDCPMARAMQRATGAWQVSISGGWALVLTTEVGPDYWVQLTREAVDWIRRFDYGEPDEPRSFVFERAER